MCRLKQNLGNLGKKAKQKLYYINNTTTKWAKCLQALIGRPVLNVEVFAEKVDKLAFTFFFEVSVLALNLSRQCRRHEWKIFERTNLMILLDHIKSSRNVTITIRLRAYIIVSAHIHTRIQSLFSLSSSKILFVFPSSHK